MSIKEGDVVEYEHSGQAWHAIVEAVVYSGGLKARIVPAHPSHPRNIPVSKLKRVGNNHD